MRRAANIVTAYAAFATPCCLADPMFDAQHGLKTVSVTVDVMSRTGDPTDVQNFGSKDTTQFKLAGEFVLQ